MRSRFLFNPISRSPTTTTVLAVRPRLNTSTMTLLSRPLWLLALAVPAVSGFLAIPARPVRTSRLMSSGEGESAPSEQPKSFSWTPPPQDVELDHAGMADTAIPKSSPTLTLDSEVRWRWTARATAAAAAAASAADQSRCSCPPLPLTQSLATTPPPLRRRPTTHAPPTHHLPTTYSPPTHHLPTTYPPPTHHRSQVFVLDSDTNSEPSAAELSNENMLRVILGHATDEEVRSEEWRWVADGWRRVADGWRWVADG